MKFPGGGLFACTPLNNQGFLVLVLSILGTGKKIMAEIMKISIRRACDSEAHKLSEISLAAKKYWDYPESFFEHWNNALRVSPGFIVNNNVWVATHNNEILGFAAISIKETVAELEHMWVIPKHIKKGVGKHLMKTVIEYCKDAGMAYIRIESDPNARVFYEKLGARMAGYVESKPEPRKLPVLKLEL